MKSDRLLEMGKPGAINAGEFKDTVRRFVQEINLPAYFDFDSPPIDPAKIDMEFVSRPTFVRQLELIEASKQQQLQAINDYLRAISSKTRWGEEGYCFRDHWTNGRAGFYSGIRPYATVLTCFTQVSTMSRQGRVCRMSEARAVSTREKRPGALYSRLF